MTGRWSENAMTEKVEIFDKKIEKGVYKGWDVLYIIRANAEVVKRQTRCLQAAVPTRREGSNPFLRTICKVSLQTKAFLFIRKTKFV